MPNFFIDRPIFAWVIAIIIMLAGGLADPEAACRAISNDCAAGGDNFRNPTLVLMRKRCRIPSRRLSEQNMNGIDNLMYMSSNSDSTGTVQITLTFQSGTDADIAQVQVQNKLQLAMPLLPQEVQQQGVSVEKSSSSFLMVVGVINTNGTMTQEDISDYVGANMKDAISPYVGRGRRSAVWFPVRDAYLDGSEQAEQLPADAGRCH
ncbi:Acriflavine resistance protein B [Raoultella terrigena]|uniref:Acriflavine resistance protein B n=1 Tax=Raoultella terrigena TaxID=577 RepID=A0A4U9D950_RAOTE|nr:Acriflavine resistance protein B [Raoultella terrigena]